MNEEREKLHEIQLKLNQWNSLKELIIMIKWEEENENIMNTLIQ